MKTGIANLPLHGGQAPPWLFKKMTDLSREITIYIVENYGSDEFLNRVSNPIWFQSLGSVLGFDWHSSGLTTTTTAALKEGIEGMEHELGIYICGGKGKTAVNTPKEIANHAPQNTNALIKASKLSAKVDNTALQDGYNLYHHAFFFNNKGKWAVVQQGMNEQTKYARRYHWLSDNVKSFVEEPHDAVVGVKEKNTLNLVHKKSKKSRKSIVEVAQENPDNTLKLWNKIVELNLPARHEIKVSDLQPRFLKKVLVHTYENKTSDFEDLLGVDGLGPKTLRALTLLAEVATGAQPSFEDPVQYSFAHGGKDGIPYPVDRRNYDHSINFMKNVINGAKIGVNDKSDALKQLYFFEQDAISTTN